MKKQKGFTLIELLVVIAIIAILSTVVMAGLNSARAKGRDAKRLSDIKQLQTALELFFDTCGGYPTQTRGDITAANSAGVTTGLNIGTNDANNGGTACASNLGTFINPLPLNPGPNGITYQYCSASMTDPVTVPAAPATALPVPDCTPSVGSNYRILFNLEGTSGSLGAGNHLATPGGIL